MYLAMNKNILRKDIQKTIHEIGVILLYVVLSVAISYLFYTIFYSLNMPPTISDIDQKQFSNEVSNRMYGAFGDIKLKYLGIYKYDYKITSMTDLDNINESRLRILKSTAKNYSLYIGWGSLFALILVRYLSRFLKWLYCKEQENEVTKQ